MDTKQFRWAWTALVTPFNEDGSIDWEAFDNLVEMQVIWWVTWILLLGTTWENPSLTAQESVDIVTRWVEKIAGRCKIMVNTWTNDTNKSIVATKKIAELWWIDAILIVNPYYNKPTQKWLYMHFKAVANAISLPVFVYNIKWRTWVNLETDTLLRLVGDCKNIVWVKEASGDMDQIKDVIRRSPDDFIVLSWDDDLTLSLIQEGGDGVISVASNFLPRQISDFVNFALQNDSKAEEMKWELKAFFQWEFIQTNPLPIKAALAYTWHIKEVYRLPMCPMDESERNKWIEIVQKYSKVY